MTLNPVLRTNYEKQAKNKLIAKLSNKGNYNQVIDSELGGGGGGGRRRRRRRRKKMW